MRVKTVLVGALAIAVAGAVGFLAWAQRPEIARMKLPPEPGTAQPNGRAHTVPPSRARWALRGLLGLFAVLVIAAIAFVAWGWHREIAAIEPPRRSMFDQASIEKGSRLAAIGNCNVCHTKPGGESFAGGAALPTPFGTIYGSNITPDAATGIGSWSEDAFRRSLREGVDRLGRHLYPAFPYDHFTKLTDEDIAAIYAYLMTREPVRAETPPPNFPFPLNIRFTVTGWKLLYFRPGVEKPDLNHDEEWNRGKYLTDGLAHCGACHTPRNRLGAERRREYLGGGSAEGWHAPALNTRSPAPVPWTTDDLYAYLREGRDDEHGAAFGPMVPVVRNLRSAPESDVHAIAVYVGSIIHQPGPEHPPPPRERRATRPVSETTGSVQGVNQPDPGAVLYAGACAGCHESESVDGSQGLDLAWSTAVAGPDPRNVIRVVLDGIHPREGERGVLMPGFRDALTDRQTADLVGYVRSRFSSQPPWKGLAPRVRAIREGKDNS